MTKENRETMQRAIGIIEGVSYGASVRVTDALALVSEMLTDVLDSEEKDDANTVRYTKQKEAK